MENKSLVVVLSKRHEDFVRCAIEEISRRFDENQKLMEINNKLYDIFNENEAYSSIEIVPDIISDRIESNNFWISRKLIGVVNVLFQNGYDDAAKYVFVELSNRYYLW